MTRVYCLYDKRDNKVYIGENLSEIARKIRVTYACLYRHMKNKMVYSNNKYAILSIDKEEYIKKPGNNPLGMGDNLIKKEVKEMAYFRDDI